MKNQLDLIISGVAIVVMGICVGVFYGTKPTVQKPTPPQQPELSAVKQPKVKVVMSNALPGGARGGKAGGGSGGGRGGGIGGGGKPGPSAGPKM